MAEIMTGVHCIDLCFQGQSGAIAAYLLTSADGTEAALIDTGPTTTRGALLQGLRDAGVDPGAVTTVLVSHIHFDHAGAAGVLRRDDLPNARVLVHPVGRPHLIDPARLIRSATRLYGDRMEMLWGEIAGLPEDVVLALEDGAELTLAGHSVDILFTPGHAAHHVAVYHRASGAVFTGDAAGVRVPGAAIINPPTVPPEFDPDAWRASIDRMLALQPARLLLAHFGAYDDAQAHLAELKRQLERWISVVRRELEAGRSVEDIAAILRTADLASPQADPGAAHALDLIAGYGISVAGIVRYLSK